MGDEGEHEAWPSSPWPLERVGATEEASRLETRKPVYVPWTIYPSSDNKGQEFLPFGEVI